MTLLHDWQNAPTEDHPLVRLGRLLQSAGYAFTTISPPSHRRVNAREHNAAASDLRGVFGWNRPFDGALLEPEMLHLMDSAGILLADGARYRSALRASTLGGQLYFHSAYPTHDVDSVFFGPDTYRYQQVIDTALATTPPAPVQVRRAADIGCGAAPGAVIVARHYPQAEVWGVDINPRALALAAVNVRVAGLENVRLARSDLLAALDGEFDLIVSNPPFMVDDDQRTYCHGGGSLGEGLSLSIVACAIERLAPGGQLVL
ncbi:MAG: class I SAM-dependent methyltransferase, partial [Duganella sp.]